MRDKILGFALRAAGSAGVAFREFALWLSPWGWSRRDLSPLLRDMREEGLTELTEDTSGEILEVRLTDRGERELASLSAERQTSGEARGGLLLWGHENARANRAGGVRAWIS